MSFDVLKRLLELGATQPDRIAVMENGTSVTYAEFSDLVRRYAAAFSAVGTAPNVLINLNAGIQAYAAMFGALMAGGYYSPMNVEYPLELRMTIMGLFKPNIVVIDADSPELDKFKSECGHVLSPQTLADQRLLEIRPAHEIAYVIFTSGSTGTPKGVALPRSALNSFIPAAIQELGATQKDRWSQYANIGFDFSVFDIYGALTSGGALCALSTPADRLMPALAVKRDEITIWSSVPSIVDLMRRTGSLTNTYLSSLRMMLFCGEALLREHLASIFTACPDVDVVNTYGPTEATVFCTTLWLTASNYESYTRHNVAIGAPLPTTEIAIWDEQDGEGELILMGAQLAKGYLGDKEKTQSSFRTINIDGKEQRAYFTGDSVRRSDGQIYFLSRIDRQVKVFGYRIELGQIDSALRRLGYAAACTVFTDNLLVSFIETADQVDDADIQEGLLEQLPKYMVPKKIFALPSMPLNANGKVDVKALIGEYAKRVQPNTNLR